MSWNGIYIWTHGGRLKNTQISMFLQWLPGGDILSFVRLEHFLRIEYNSKYQILTNEHRKREEKEVIFDCKQE